MCKPLLLLTKKYLFMCILNNTLISDQTILKLFGRFNPAQIPFPHPFLLLPQEKGRLLRIFLG
jgi:hypothetical protein